MSMAGPANGTILQFRMVQAGPTALAGGLAARTRAVMKDRIIKLETRRELFHRPPYENSKYIKKEGGLNKTEDARLLTFLENWIKLTVIRISDPRRFL